MVDCCDDKDLLDKPSINSYRVKTEIPESWKFSSEEIPPAENVPQKASARQVGGEHYKDFKISLWQFFQINNIPFHKADIIKRILRFDFPTGKGQEDLDKIKHEIELIEEFWKK